MIGGWAEPRRRHFCVSSYGEEEGRKKELKERERSSGVVFWEVFVFCFLFFFLVKRRFI